MDLPTIIRGPRRARRRGEATGQRVAESSSEMGAGDLETGADEGEPAAPFREVAWLRRARVLLSPLQHGPKRRAQQQQQQSRQEEERFRQPAGPDPPDDDDLELDDDDYAGLYAISEDNRVDLATAQLLAGGRLQALDDELSVGEDEEDNDIDEIDEAVGAIEDPDLDEGLGDLAELAELAEDLPVNVFDPAALGLKEINNLAHFGVSSHKPGNGVAELLDPDLEKYWQSDGQQPHLLTIHFVRRVEIRAIRFFVDFINDESYTPTHVVLYAGTGHHDLIQFADMMLQDPIGWQDVPIAGSGGGPDGNSLACWVVQMHVKENHQNGKDTHIRGMQIYALDDNGAETEVADVAGTRGEGEGRTFRRSMRSVGDFSDDGLDMWEHTEETDEAIHSDGSELPAENWQSGLDGGFSSSDLMRDPEIR